MDVNILYSTALRASSRSSAATSLALSTSLTLLIASSAGAQTAPPTDTRLHARAVAVTSAIAVDGRLDEADWKRAPLSPFVQSEPNTGAPATERTDVWLAYDHDALYIAAYCHDRPGQSPVVTGLRKDFTIGDQDSFEVILDTFGDRRNGFLFATNPAGARADQQVTNEGKDTNASWDAVWTVKTQRVADGWTLEMQIPFRSLRFEVGGPAWGVNFGRHLRHTNEIDYWSPVPRAYTLTRVSLAGVLDGLDSAQPGRNLQIKPFVLGSTVRPTGGASFDRSLDAGIDVKYGVTPALTLDITGRPDFAQAEADEQSVNLTQFSQFFPEKRAFFLENSGVFYVGDAARNNRVNPTPTPDEDLLLFFSRRVGLSSSGLPIPITAGARLTGRAAGMAVGALAVHTEEAGVTPSADYTVLRARRNFRGASDVGAFFMSKQSGDGTWNRVYGADANIRLPGNVDWSSYVVNTAAPGSSGATGAWRTSFNHEGNYFHGKIGVMEVGRDFRDDLGYYRRVGARKWLMDTGIRPRPITLQNIGVRELHPHLNWNYYTTPGGRMIAKNFHNGFSAFLNNGGVFELSHNPQMQSISSPLRLATTAPTLPAGDYTWTEWRMLFQTDASRPLSISGNYIWGGLWNGTQRTIQATVTLLPSYRARVSVGINRTAATMGTTPTAFVTSLYTLRANYSFTTNMYLDALVQFNADLRQMNTNVRFNLLHHPLSDLFIVYNEQRFTTTTSVTPGRGLILKFSQMLAF